MPPESYCMGDFLLLITAFANFPHVSILKTMIDPTSQPQS
jgi:hypothetical protein